MEKTLIRLLDSDYQLVLEKEYYLEFTPDFFIFDGEIYQYHGSYGNSVTYQWAGSSLELNKN